MGNARRAIFAGFWGGLLAGLACWTLNTMEIPALAMTALVASSAWRAARHIPDGRRRLRNRQENLEFQRPASGGREPPLCHAGMTGRFETSIARNRQSARGRLQKFKLAPCQRFRPPIG